MNQPPYDDEFDQLFSQAQVDLPPHLKTRLLTIPYVTPQASFWDLRWIVPVVSLIPAIFWLAITKVLPLLRTVTEVMVSWAGDLTIPAIPVLPAPSMVVIGFCLSVILVSTTAGIWIYWRFESRITLEYGKYLTSHL